MVPGIDFSNDPLLAGRIHSYFDTQLLRLGGPNSTRSLSTRPSRRRITTSATASTAKPFSRAGVVRAEFAGGGCPFQSGSAGFTHSRSQSQMTKCAESRRSSRTNTRKRRSSGTARRLTEKAHIVRAFRFELRKCRFPPSVNAPFRCCAMSRDELARQVADGLGIPLPKAMPLVIAPRRPEVKSQRRSLSPSDRRWKHPRRKIAILIAAGVDSRSVARRRRHSRKLALWCG